MDQSLARKLMGMQGRPRLADRAMAAMQPPPMSGLGLLAQALHGDPAGAAYVTAASLPGLDTGFDISEALTGWDVSANKGQGAPLSGFDRALSAISAAVPGIAAAAVRRGTGAGNRMVRRLVSMFHASDDGDLVDAFDDPRGTFRYTGDEDILGMLQDIGVDIDNLSGGQLDMIVDAFKKEQSAAGGFVESRVRDIKNGIMADTASAKGDDLLAAEWFNRRMKELDHPENVGEFADGDLFSGRWSPYDTTDLELMDGFGGYDFFADADTGFKRGKALFEKARRLNVKKRWEYIDAIDGLKKDIREGNW